ncbi:MAG: pirin family protein [Acidimicrobiales bacterium]
MAVDLTTSHDAEVGGLPVRRALPRRGRRTVGAWCFLDHFGPVDGDQADAMQVGPHPHIGLQTVTWLLDGEVLHTDSVGSEQVIRPGQLNLMTAGRGVAHAESSQSGGRGCHGIQLWVAQPEATRHGEPAFEHHPELPKVELGTLEATVLSGSLHGTASPARHDTPLVGADLALETGVGLVPLEPTWEHALVVAYGSIEVDGTPVRPGSLAYLGDGRDELAIRATGPARVLLIGGAPFESEIVMWWNFVARSRDEVTEARADWEAHGARFADVRTPLDRISAPTTPWPEPTIL